MKRPVVLLYLTGFTALVLVAFIVHAFRRGWFS